MIRLELFVLVSLGVVLRVKSLRILLNFLNLKFYLTYIELSRLFAAARREI